MEGRKGNVAGLIHGGRLKLHTRKVDGRCQLGKWLNAMRKSLISDLGGTITTAQAVLIERIAHKTANAHYFEHGLARGETQDYKNYISLTNSLRADLQLLGLERKEKMLLSYLDERGEHADQDKRN